MSPISASPILPLWQCAVSRLITAGTKVEFAEVITFLPFSTTQPICSEHLNLTYFLTCPRFASKLQGIYRVSVEQSLFRYEENHLHPYKHLMRYSHRVLVWGFSFLELASGLPLSPLSSIGTIPRHMEIKNDYRMVGPKKHSFFL